MDVINNHGVLQRLQLDILHVDRVVGDVLDLGLKDEAVLHQLVLALA